MIAVDESPSMVRRRASACRAPTCAIDAGRPGRAAGRGAAGRDPLDGHLPLDRRPRAAVRAAARCAAPRRAARRAVRGEGNIDVLRGRARVLAREPYAEHFASFRPPWNYAAAGADHARAAARRRLRRGRVLAGSRRRASPSIRASSSRRSCSGRSPAAPGAAARAVHGRRAGRARRAGRRRLRAAEHRRYGA